MSPLQTILVVVLAASAAVNAVPLRLVDSNHHDDTINGPHQIEELPNNFNAEHYNLISGLGPKVPDAAAEVEELNDNTKRILDDLQNKVTAELNAGGGNVVELLRGMAKSEGLEKRQVPSEATEELNDNIKRILDDLQNKVTAELNAGGGNVIELLRGFAKSEGLEKRQLQSEVTEELNVGGKNLVDLLGAIAKAKGLEEHQLQSEVTEELNAGGKDFIEMLRGIAKAKGLEKRQLQSQVTEELNGGGKELVEMLRAIAEAKGLEKQ